MTQEGIPSSSLSAENCAILFWSLAKQTELKLKSIAANLNSVFISATMMELNRQRVKTVIAMLQKFRHVHTESFGEFLECLMLRAMLAGLHHGDAGPRQSRFLRHVDLCRQTKSRSA